MHAIEFETTINTRGNIHLPERYQGACGKTALLRLRFPEPLETKQIQPAQCRPGSARGILEILSENDKYPDDFRDRGVRTPSHTFPTIDGLLADRVDLDAHADTGVDPVQEALDELKAERAAHWRESEKMLAPKSDS